MSQKQAAAMLLHAIDADELIDDTLPATTPFKSFAMSYPAQPLEPGMRSVICIYACRRISSVEI